MERIIGILGALASIAGLIIEITKKHKRGTVIAGVCLLLFGVWIGWSLYINQKPNGRIITPAPNSTVSSPVMVSGTIGHIKEGQHLFLAVHAQNSPGLFWPQPELFPDYDGNWNSTAFLGGGTVFELALWLCDEKVATLINTWRRECEERNDWPGLSVSEARESGWMEKVHSITVHK